jgi:predicted permease
MIMSVLMQDLRYALRQLRKSPGFAAAALATLALGIGANTGIFTLVNAVMLKALPVPKTEQLFLVIENDFKPQNTRFSYPFFKQARAVMPRGSQLAAAAWPGDFYASFGGGESEMVKGQLVSGSYFATLETYAELGRLLDENDDRAIGGSPVAVISFGCWERRFGRDPNVIGRKLAVNGMPIQIVGVAAQKFFGTRVGTAPEFWLPTSMQSVVRYQQHYSNKADFAAVDKPWIPQPDIAWLQFIIRVNDPRQVAPISVALNQVFHLDQVRTASQEGDPSEREGILRAQLRLVPGARGLPNLQNTFSKPLLALMAMVAIILLIACANLANLLLVRAAAREREIAVRLSLGSTRIGLVRQLLVECILLSLCGAACGVAIAYWLTSVLPRWASSGSSPIPINLTPDARVLLFSAVIAILTGIVFGLAPALQGSRVEPIHALRSGVRAASGGGQWSLKQGLVTAQIALSLVLLVGAGLFVRTLRNYSTLDPGFDRDRLITVQLDTHLAHYSPAQLASLYRSLIDRVDAIPGVRSASLLSCEIADGCGDASDIFLPDVPHSNGETDAQERFVSHGFFETTAIPLLRGRFFADSDTEKSPKVVVVNEAFVRQFLPGEDPIGQFYGYDAANPRQYEIVGVVKDSRFNDVREPVPPTIFHSLSQDVIDVASLNVRTFTDPSPMVAEIREAVRSVDANLPIGDSRTVANVVSEGLWGHRLIARLASIFGALALGLACLGLYGVLSYSVARRTAELGVRLALGAPRQGLLWLVLHQTLAMAAIGIAAGVLLSAAAGRTVRSLLFGLSPHDPATIFIAAIVLLAVSVGSGLIPALRAARVNPSDALRGE